MSMSTHNIAGLIWMESIKCIRDFWIFSFNLCERACAHSFEIESASLESVLHLLSVSVECVASFHMFLRILIFMTVSWRIYYTFVFFAWTKWAFFTMIYKWCDFQMRSSLETQDISQCLWCMAVEPKRWECLPICAQFNLITFSLCVFSIFFFFFGMSICQCSRHFVVRYLSYL